MGIANVKRVYATSAKLPDLPFRLLTWMAVRSMDDHRPPLYWAGWEELATAAGRAVPSKDEADRNPVAARARRAALKAINGAVKVLVDQDHVHVHHAAAPGRNTVYALLIWNLPTVHGQRESCGDSVHGDREWNGARLADNGSRSTDNGARSADTTVHGHRAPEDQPQEQEEEVKEENTFPPAPHAPTTEAHRGEGDDPNRIQNLVSAVRDLRPEWTGVAIRRALERAADEGRPRDTTLAALLAIARGDYGTSQSPNRVNADGPWWTLRPTPRAKAGPSVAELLAELRTKPDCEHGDPGGDQPHPVSGEPLCALCRRDRRAAQ